MHERGCGGVGSLVVVVMMPEFVVVELEVVRYSG